MANVKKEKFIINGRGEKQAVILDIKDYTELIEDLSDLRIMAERKDGPTSTLEEIEDRLKEHGLL